MGMPHLVCGSCDFEINSAEKLQSHYVAQHGLSNGDAGALTRSNIGELMSGQEWFDSFYEDLKSYAEAKQRGDFNKDQRLRGVLNKRVVLGIARKAAHLL